MTYYGGFTCRRDIEDEFAPSCSVWPRDPLVLPDNIEILFAAYGSGGYDGDAFVLYRDSETGKLFEVNASHCSCYGLEDQWRPEETTVEALMARKGILSSYSHDEKTVMALGVVLAGLGKADEWEPCPFCASHRAAGYQVKTCEDCCGSGVIKKQMEAE